eukprot:tig00020552_g10474.t1
MIKSNKSNISKQASFWTHYAVVLDTDAGYARATIYINGTRFGSTNRTIFTLLVSSPYPQPRIVIQLDPNPLRVMYPYTMTNGGFLSLREVRYWSRALNASEIQDNWARKVVYRSEQYPSVPSLVINVPLTLGGFSPGAPLYPSNFVNDVTGTAFFDAGSTTPAVFVRQNLTDAFLCDPYGPPASLEVRGGASIHLSGGKICLGAVGLPC